MDIHIRIAGSGLSAWADQPDNQQVGDEPRADPPTRHVLGLLTLVELSVGRVKCLMLVITGVAQKSYPR